MVSCFLHHRSLISCVTGALACGQLVGCVGEIRQGTYSATAGEAGVEDPDGAPVDPGKGGAPADGAVRPSDPNAGLSEAGTHMGSPEAGVARADATTPAPVDASRDAQVADTGVPTNPDKKPVFVVVGYSGVRLASRDLGKTWQNIVTSGGSGDDNNLLRAVAYGNGLFVAAGWRIWTSSDAITWTEQTNPAKQWMGGIQYGLNMFVAAGGYGSSIYSSDGLTWQAGQSRNNEPGRSVAFGNGMWLTGTDQSWWSTTNGNNWTVQSSGHASNQVMWCKDKFSDPADCTDPLARNTGHTAYGEGVWVSSAGNSIERSEDGKTWTKVQDTTANPVEGVTFGYVTQ